MSLLAYKHVYTVTAVLKLINQTRIQAKSGPHVEYEAGSFSPIPGLCARVQTFGLRWGVG